MGRSLIRPLRRTSHTRNSPQNSSSLYPLLLPFPVLPLYPSLLFYRTRCTPLNFSPSLETPYSFLWYLTGLSTLSTHCQVIYGPYHNSRMHVKSNVEGLSSTLIITSEMYVFLTLYLSNKRVPVCQSVTSLDPT